MPITKRKDELEDKYFLDDDSSDEEEDESSDDSDDEESDSGSDSDDSGSGSGSDSDDSDSDSDDESSSGSDSDDSSLKKKKKGKNSKNDEKKDEEDDQPMSTLYKIRQISSKLSWLLDDLHKTFKPKSVPKIDPKDVFPYPYIAIPQFSPSKHYQHNNVIIESNNNLKSPISSPIRHGNAIDRGTGGNYIFPSYALPPSKNEIKKLYRNYSDDERQKIKENQTRQRERKFLFSRKSKSDSNLWERNNFSDEFISASNKRNKTLNNSRFKSIFGLNKRDNEIDNRTMPHTFDELYKHYDQQKRLIEQKQARMNGMKNRLYWFRKNTCKNVSISEKKPLMIKDENENENESKNEQIHNTKKSLKETEKNLLNKAAQILLGCGNDKPSTSQYDVVCPDSPDSLQQKILHIASDDDENRMPKFV
eukprot:997672_1